MNDLELLDKYYETCLDFIHPLIFRDIEARGLTWVIEHLPSNTAAAKAVIRARLAKVGKAFGDDEIDQIANEIQHLESLRNKLNKINITDAHQLLPILEEMKAVSEFVLSYYKPIQLPK
jgi:hypothetical protein